MPPPVEPCQLPIFGMGGENILACGLQGEGEYVSADEELGEPSLLYHSARIAIHKLDDTGELHVDARSEEGWRDQEEKCLHDVWA